MDLYSLVQRYCELSKLEDPSEEGLDKLAAILDLAQYDRELTCLIDLANHLIAFEMGW